MICLSLNEQHDELRYQHFLIFVWWLDCCQSLYLTPRLICLLQTQDSHAHPPLPASIPHLAAIEVNIGGGGGGGDHRQVALLATRMYLSPDPWRPWQEVNRWPSDLPWCPFLSSCCLAGRKDAVCCPQAPLTRSSLLSPTRNQIIDSRLVSPNADFFVLLFCLFHFPSSSQLPLYPILT